VLESGIVQTLTRWQRGVTPVDVQVFCHDKLS
jgi:hypothetical protein